MKTLLLLCFLALSFAQNCQDCPSCDPVANPDFPVTDGCSANIVLVIDESSSLQANRDTVAEGLKQFWNGVRSFNEGGGSARLAVVEFSEEARIVSEMTSVDSALTTTLDAYADSSAEGAAGYSPAGTTNWAIAMFTVNTHFVDTNSPDIVIFFTDGEPNSHAPAVCDGACYPWDQNNGDVGTACYHADLIKTRGIKIFTVAVGDVLGSSTSFQVISGGSTDSASFGDGATEWNRVASSFGTADYVVDGDLANLGTILATISNALCPSCVQCTIFPTNPNPDTMECVAATIPNLEQIQFTSSGQCGNPRHGTGVEGWDTGCKQGTITTTLAVFDQCDQESDRTQSYTTTVVDTTGPTLICPASRTSAESTTCEQALQDLEALAAVATDTCSEVIVSKGTVNEMLDTNGKIVGYETTFTAADACGNAADAACAVEYPCTDGADLEIIKSSNIEECAVAGSEEKDIRYTITVKNNGGVTATDVEVVDIYPTGGELEQRGAITATVGEITSSVTGFTWELGDLEAGATATASFRIYLAASYPTGIVENRATVSSPTPDPDDCNNEFTDHIRVCRESDLSVTKTDHETQVTAGELFGESPKIHVYEIVVHNDGVSDANNVKLVDEWPEGFTFGETSIGQGGACFQSVDPQPNGFNCRWSTIPAGESRVVLATYTVPADTEAGMQVNTVHVSSDSKDMDISNNHARDSTWVRTEADVSVTKDDEVDDVTAGDGQLYTYTIRVTNHGPSTAREVRLIDIWPEGIVAEEGSLHTSQGSCTSNNLPRYSFSCNHEDLAPGESARVTIRYRVPADTQGCDACNVVNVISSVYDPDTCNNDASDCNAILEKATLRVTKQASASEIQLGDSSPYTYSIYVFNEGPSKAHQVHVTDTWPVELTQFPNTIRATQGGCVTTGGDFSCSLGAIPAGFQAIITIDFSLNHFAWQPGIVSNTAVAFSPTDTQCRTDTVSIQVVESIGGKRRKDMSTEIEHVHIAARARVSIENVMTLTLNVTNVHDHPVELNDIKLDEHVMPNSDKCTGVIAARSSEVCTVEMTAFEKKPKHVFITGTGSDGRPLEGKAQINKRNRH